MNQEVLVKQVARGVLIKGLNSGRDNRYIRGSSLGMCGRRIGYTLLGYQGGPHNAHTQFIFDQGNALHDALQLQLSRMGWVDALPRWDDQRSSLEWDQGSDSVSGCELDVIDHQMRVLGHLDGITVPLSKNAEGELLPDPGGERYLLEIKTISDRPNFWALGVKDGGTYPLKEKDNPADWIEIKPTLSKTSGKQMQCLTGYSHSRKVVHPIYGVRECPVYKVNLETGEQLVTIIRACNTLGAFSQLEKPKPAHILQASYYANHYNLKKILFLYVAKDSNFRDYKEEADLLNYPMKIYEHAVDPLDILFIKDKVAGIYRMTDKGALPPKEWDSPDDSGSECGYCPFLFECHPKFQSLMEVNGNLLKAGLPPISPGSGITHTPEADLAQAFADQVPR